MNKKDIENRADVECLVQKFYAAVRDDATLAPFFAAVNWDTHLPRMFDFWENVLFYSGGFQGNPMKKHIEVHQRMPIPAAAFDEWLVLFKKVLDTHFEGPKAALAMQRAISIGTVIQLKIYKPSPQA